VKSGRAVRTSRLASEPHTLEGTPPQFRGQSALVRREVRRPRFASFAFVRHRARATSFRAELCGGTHVSRTGPTLGCSGSVEEQRRCGAAARRHRGGDGAGAGRSFAAQAIAAVAETGSARSAGAPSPSAGARVQPCSRRFKTSKPERGREPQERSCSTPCARPAREEVSTARGRVGTGHAWCPGRLKRGVVWTGRSHALREAPRPGARAPPPPHGALAGTSREVKKRGERKRPEGGVGAGVGGARKCRGEG